MTKPVEYALFASYLRYSSIQAGLKRPRPALYPQITLQNASGRVRPRRGAQAMVIPLPSIATRV